jgi:hypothetical protein
MNTPILDKIDELIALIKFMKIGDRSPDDRRFAITITELEKVRAYIFTYLENDNNGNT